MKHHMHLWAIALVAAGALALGIQVVLAAPEASSSVAAATDAGGECGACHSGPARDWAKSKMASLMDCEVCHTGTHVSGGGAGGEGTVSMPTPDTCRPCHEAQVAQFEAGKHAYAWEALQVVPNYRIVPESARETGCNGCHDVGRTWDDGSRGKCNSCHGRHTFSATEAREPEACGHCHVGDHPQYDIWQSSRHGRLYLLTRDEERAPKCQTCHMPEGDHMAITSWGFLGLRGQEPDAEWAKIRQPIANMLQDLGPARAPNVMRETMGEWQAGRDQMIDTCARCHSRSFAQDKLATADAHLKATDSLFSTICETAYTLHDQGIIDEMKRQSFTRGSLAHRLSSFMGAFHFGYEYAWDEGYLALMDDALKLKDEAMTGAILKAVQSKLKLLPGGLPTTIPGIKP